MAVVCVLVWHRCCVWRYYLDYGASVSFIVVPMFCGMLLRRFWSMLLLDAVPLLEADTVCFPSVNNYPAQRYALFLVVCSPLQIRSSL